MDAGGKFRCCDNYKSGVFLSQAMGRTAYSEGDTFPGRVVWNRRSPNVPVTLDSVLSESDIT